MNRQEANRQIVAKLGWLAEKYPEWRFQQILQNSGVVSSGGDQWYEESDYTLRTMEKMTKGW